MDHCSVLHLVWQQSCEYQWLEVQTARRLRDTHSPTEACRDQ